MARSTPDHPRLRAVRSWRATYSPALAVTAGQRVTPGRIDEDHPGWKWVVDETDLGGWIPAAILAGDTVTETFDTAELTIAEGDCLAPIARRLGWTLCRTEDGRTGWLPDSCIAPAA